MPTQRDCGTCNGSGMLFDSFDMPLPCPDCGAAPILNQVEDPR